MRLVAGAVKLMGRRPVRGQGTSTGRQYYTLDLCAGKPYFVGMQTVIETDAYLGAAHDAGMTEDERQAAVCAVSHNPTAGDLMPGTGGCRKLRIAGRGKGKSGGYRVIHYYGGVDVPVFLLTVFSKGERANLSRAECNALEKLTRTLVASLTKKVVAIRRESQT